MKNIQQYIKNVENNLYEELLIRNLENYLFDADEGMLNKFLNNIGVEIIVKKSVLQCKQEERLTVRK